jgi:hypothetical protein
MLQPAALPAHCTAQLQHVPLLLLQCVALPCRHNLCKVLLLLQQQQRHLLRCCLFVCWLPATCNVRWCEQIIHDTSQDVMLNCPNVAAPCTGSCISQTLLQEYHCHNASAPA